MAALHCWDQLKTENGSDNLAGNVFESLQGDLLKEKHHIVIEVPYKNVTALILKLCIIHGLECCEVHLHCFTVIDPYKNLKVFGNLSNRKKE